MTALAAARLHDEIAHGFGLAAMIGGAIIGAAAGAAILAATTLTGGAALVVMAGAVAVGGLSMGKIVSGITTIFKLPEPTTGEIVSGSDTVATNGRKAVRAGVDLADTCNGLPFNHPPLPTTVMVREGSATVSIEGHPAARLKSRLTCGAHLKTASPDVVIGGPDTTVGFIFDVESWTKSGLELLGLGALIGGGLFAAAAGFASFAAYAAIAELGNLALKGLGKIGDAIGPGYGDLLEGLGGMAMLAGGPKVADEAQIASDRAEITKLSDAGNITDARAILQKHVDAKDVNAIVRRLDVSSPPDKGSLWSGNPVEAKAQAANRGGITLEGTSGGRVIDNWPDLGNKIPWNDGGKELWGNTSANYTNGLQGEVHVMQTPTKQAIGGGDIYREYEQGPLDEGVRTGRVTNVIHDTLPEPPPRP